MESHLRLLIALLIISGCVSTEPKKDGSAVLNPEQAESLIFSKFGAYQPPSKCCLAILGGYETKSDEQFCQKDKTIAMATFQYDITSCTPSAPDRYEVYREAEDIQNCTVRWQQDGGDSGAQQVLFYSRDGNLYLDPLETTG